MLGLVGTNGIGKSTALKVLSGKLKPNLGRFEVSNCYLRTLRKGRSNSLPNGNLDKHNLPRHQNCLPWGRYILCQTQYCPGEEAFS